MNNFWSVFLPDWLTAIGTIGAVVVALVLARKGSRDDLIAKYESMKPVLVPRSVVPVWDEHNINSSQLIYIQGNVTNYGMGDRGK